MKFTDGNWLMQPGIKAFRATEVFETLRFSGEGPDILELFVPTQPIRHRGDTLQGPALTIQLSSPAEGMIRVRAQHFSGQEDRGPNFELNPSQSATAITDEAEYVTFASGALRARIDKKNWKIEFLDEHDQLVTSSPPRGLGLIQSDTGESYMFGQLTLGVGENVYGLGERFTAFVKNGQVLDSWNRDGGTGSDQAYKCVPFYLTNAGYGVLVNHPEQISFEIASEKVSRVQFSVPGETVAFLVIAGPTPKEVLTRYTALTGRPALPPAWSFGLWLTTSFTTSYDEQTVKSFLDGMAERDLPLSVFHFDCFWMKAFRWCDFTWDEDVFPDPAGMLSRLHQRGLKVCVWINPYIAQRSALFEEARREGFLLHRTDGSVWQWDLWQPGMGIVDFTNPDACAWYAGKLRALLDMGVDSFKTDFGERIPVDDVVWFDGSDPHKMHNYYAQLYNQVVFDLLREVRGEGEAVVFARSATAGGQQFPVHWGGDCDSTFESMAESLRGGLSLGLSGYGFWSHDIGGFEGNPPAELYKRWVAFGLLSSHSRLHGSSSYRVPWIIDDEAVEVLRHFTHLKNRLMPYLYAQAVQATEKGWPMLRAMLLEFPDDPTCAYLDRQYMLGESLLVAPVFRADGVVEYYLPAGRWTEYQTGRVLEGPRWVKETHDFFSVPLWVREGTLLPIGHDETRPDYDYHQDVTLRLYELADGAEAHATIPSLQGSTDFRVTAKCAGNTLQLHQNWHPRVFNIEISGHQPVRIDAADVDMLLS